MIEIKDKRKCSGCAACCNICPVDAIVMKSDEEGFLYPHIDMNKCIKCGKCDRVCPYLNYSEPDTDLEICYAGYNNNENQRGRSSSGGIFILLANEVLKSEGIVYGASFTNDFMVCHTSATNEVELLPLLGSKYVQSNIGYIYREIKKNLLDNKEVLFVGTTCQIAGLKKFLQKEYHNLLCIDFICLGIPSPKIWSDYLDTFFERNEINEINFKDKTLGWHNFSLRIKSNESDFCKNGRDTYFFAGYFNGLYSRKSCSECIFKTGKRVSDITLSDCWGYKTIAPELDDNKGLSSIIIHSKKGQDYFHIIDKYLVYKDTDIRYVKKYNNNYCTSKSMGKNRKKFWRDYNKIPKVQLFEKYCKKEDKEFSYYIKKIYRKIIRMLHLE